MVKKRALLLILGVFPLWSLAMPVCAGGKADQNLARADALIAEKQYDEAINILSDFSRKNPERFSEAQARLQKIYRIRDEYNSIAELLLNEVSSRNPDMEKIINLSNRLLDLEDTNNPMVQSFINRSREMAMFNFYRQRLGDILVRGREQIEQEDFAGALRTYYTGMDIYQEDFFNAGYGSIVEEQVSGGIENIDSIVESFDRVTSGFEQAVTEIVQALNQNVPFSRINELYDSLTNSMNGLIQRQRLLYRTAASFDEQLLKFQREGNTIGDRNFLSFATRLLHGRTGETVQEGFLGVLEGYWNTMVGKAEQAFQNRMDSVYTTGLTSAYNRDFSAARQQFINAAEYYRYPLDLLIKNRELSEEGNSQLVTVMDQVVLSDNLEKFLRIISMNDAIGCLIQGCDIGVTFDTSSIGLEKDSVDRWRDGMAPAAALSREQGVRSSLDAVNRDIGALADQVNQKEEELRLYQAELLENRPRTLNILLYMQNTRSVIGSIQMQVITEYENSMARYYTIANGELEKRLVSRRGQYAEGNRLIRGVLRTTNDGLTVTEYYPAEGLAVLTAMTRALVPDMQEAGNLLSQYRTEPEEYSSREKIAALRNSAQSMENELASLLTLGQNLSASARNQIAQADAYRLDGLRYYTEAQNALNRQNFDTARDRVTRAAEQYSNSLAIQESAVLRNELYPQLVSLGREINRLENEMVIRDVRELVTNARNAYFSSNFERAEELLVRAQNRWLVTHADNDEEVDYWLNIVRGAVSLRSGRVIPSTAPLYPEMSQLLSEARKTYDEGVQLLNAGRRTQGIEKFNEVRQKTREVRLMFPMNQEAGILDLMIDRVLEPQVFENSFERRVRTAIAGTERRSLDAFADLQNLAEINPRYPGMAGIINRAEIAMGFRPPPPDPRTIARSNELTASAQRILDANNVTQFEVALAQINEAILLNPDNTSATVIKDRIQNRIAQPNAIVMSSQDEAAYNLALREYQQGNYIMALGIIQRLLQNPQYRNIAKILELRRRVEALL